MSQVQWDAVEKYLNEYFVPADPVLEAALKATVAGGLPAIEVAPTHGKLLHLLARMCGAKRILEIGALGGYSTIWLARALPKGGKLISLELQPRNAEIARANVERAGLADAVEIRVGRALDSLPKLEAEGGDPFDFFFIDADKRGNPDYVRWALKLSRPGSVIVVDNVIRNGTVIDASSRDADVQGVRLLNELFASEPRLSATAIQTVGSKGYDGFAIAIVNN